MLSITDFVQSLAQYTATYKNIPVYSINHLSLLSAVRKPEYQVTHTCCASRPILFLTALQHAPRGNNIRVARLDRPWTRARLYIVTEGCPLKRRCLSNSHRYSLLAGSSLNEFVYRLAYLLSRLSRLYSCAYLLSMVCLRSVLFLASEI